MEVERTEDHDVELLLKPCDAEVNKQRCSIGGTVYAEEFDCLQDGLSSTEVHTLRDVIK